MKPEKKMSTWVWGGVWIMGALATVSQAQEPPAAGGDLYLNPWAAVQRICDADGDGNVSTEEFAKQAQRFAGLDRDGDGVLMRGDFFGVPRDISRSGRSRGI